MASSFFGVISQKETWKSSLFLFSSFIVGIVGWVLLLTLICVGVPLIILACMGLVILAIAYFVMQGLSELDVYLINTLLGAKYTVAMTRVTNEAKAFSGLSDRLKHVVTHAPLYYALFYWLIVKFILAIANLVVVVVCLFFPIDFAVRPIVYNFCDGCAKDDAAWGWMAHPAAGILCPVAGFFLFFIGLHIIVAVGKLNRFCGRLIGETDPGLHTSLLPSDGAAAGAAAPPRYSPAAAGTYHSSGAAVRPAAEPKPHSTSGELYPSPAAGGAAGAMIPMQETKGDVAV